MIILEDIDVFYSTIKSCVDTIMKARRFSDPFERRVGGGSSSGSFYQVISYLSTILYECVVIFSRSLTLIDGFKFYRFITRFKNAIVTYPGLQQLARSVQDWFSAWSEAVMSQDPETRFDDPCTQLTGRQLGYMIALLKDKVNLVVKIVNREESKLDARKELSSSLVPSKASSAHNDGLLASLHMVYQPVEGRHDNDHADINDIQIAPTSQELICESSFIPANVYGAPHHLDIGTMERELDIQFRLLREELMFVLYWLSVNLTAF
jgi:hypothetical protein